MMGWMKGSKRAYGKALKGKRHLGSKLMGLRTGRTNFTGSTRKRLKGRGFIKKFWTRTMKHRLKGWR